MSWGRATTSPTPAGIQRKVRRVRWPLGAPPQHLPEEGIAAPEVHQQPAPPPLLGQEALHRVAPFPVGHQNRTSAGIVPADIRRWAEKSGSVGHGLVEHHLHLAGELVKEGLGGGLLPLPDRRQAVLHHLLVLVEAGVVDRAPGLGGLHRLQEHPADGILEQALALVDVRAPAHGAPDLPQADAASWLVSHFVHCQARRGSWSRWSWSRRPPRSPNPGRPPAPWGARWRTT